VPLVGEELARHAKPDPVALGIWFTFDLHLEIDRAHDAIAKLLLDECFPSRPVGLDQFMETVDEGSVGGNVVNEPRFGGSVRMVVSASLKPRSFPTFSASDFVSVICPRSAAV
jgi:hypothetical protein